MTFLRGLCLLRFLSPGRRLKSLPGMTVYFSSLTAFLKKRATPPSILFFRPTPVHWSFAEHLQDYPPLMVNIPNFTCSTVNHWFCEIIGGPEIILVVLRFL